MMKAKKTETYYDAILFDLDDTLIDFAVAEKGALNAALASVDMVMTPDLLARYGQINRALWRRFDQGEVEKSFVLSTRWLEFFGELKRTVDVEALNQHFMLRLVEHSIVTEALHALVADLAFDHKLAIVTNGHGPTQRLRLERTRLAPFFSACIVSDDVGVAKPAPAIFQAALLALGLPSTARTLMVGDNLHADIGGAAALGFDTCWISGGKVLAGVHQPTYVISGMDLLPEVSKAWRKAPMEL